MNVMEIMIVTQMLSVQTQMEVTPAHVAVVSSVLDAFVPVSTHLGPVVRRPDSLSTG
jgi:hypothetical protein